MTEACVLLRHDIRPRWIGDLLAAYCHTCQPGHLIVPAPIDEPTSASRSRNAARRWRSRTAGQSARTG